MFDPEHLRRRDAAATAVVQRIRADRARLPRPLVPLLEQLEQHLFSQDLNSGRLLVLAGIRSSRARRSFLQATGTRLRTYIEICRLETALELLRDSQLEIWRIAYLVGYNSDSVFCQAFRRRWGCTPRLFRQQGQLPQPSVDNTATEAAGELFAQRAPAAQEGADEPSQAESRADLERCLVRGVWSALAERPIEEQRQALLELLHLSTPALFELLSRKSRELGRKNRQHGAQLAELAAESVERLGHELSLEQRALLHSRAWIQVSHARRLAGDYPGAQLALDRAERTLPPEHEDPEPRGSWLSAKAALFGFQHRNDEAMLLAREAVAALRKADSHELPSALMICGVIASESGAHEVGRHATVEAAWRLRRRDDDWFMISAFQLLGCLHTESGRSRTALAWIRRAGRRVRRVGGKQKLAHQHWLEGLFKQRHQSDLASAEGSLTRAKNLFVALGANELAGTVALDLAHTFIARRDFELAVEAASDALQLFDQSRDQLELVVAAGVIRQALAARNLTQETIEGVRRRLQIALSAPPIWPRSAKSQSA